MLTLSVDLSSPTGTLALFQGNTLLEEVELPETQSHSELFLGALDSLLAARGLTLEKIDRYLTTSGPGSFTGLRIAWSSLKAFALAHGKPLLVVPGDEARARASGKLSILTALGKKSWVHSRFNESLELLESAVTEESSLGEMVTLRASHLMLCPHPVELRTDAEINAAGPTYLGSRW